jgi:hypothetical protein
MYQITIQSLHRTVLFLAGMAALSLAPGLRAQTAASAGESAPAAESALLTGAPPVIDGRLNEESWRTAAAITDFVQHEPFEGMEASEQSELRILHDAEAVYVGAWMFDRDPTGIIVGETRRDASLDDTDALLLVLDTYLDRQNAFVFGTTPAGIEYDGQVTREGQGGFGGGGRPGQRQQRGSGGGLNLNWDGSWDVATSVDERGWYAEFRIPFATLRYGRGGPQEWGMNIARHVRRRNEQSFWAPIPRQHDLYRISLAGTLSGIEAPTRQTLDMTPYMLSSAHRDFDTMTKADVTGDIGGDAKIGLAPSVTLDLTYNTDFAQVEVDDEQINLTRFRLFFPEKRPFFLENAGTFSVGTPRDTELFFSRRIGIESETGSEVPILGGARLSGKVGGVTVGLLNIQTERIEEIDVGTGLSSELAPPNNFSVARVLHELPNRSRVGAIFVSRLNTGDTDDYNLTYAVDGRMGIGDAVTLNGYAARTETPGITGSEHAVNFDGSYATRNWSGGFSFREVGENFNPEVGFLTRSSYRFLSGRILRHIRVPSVSWFRELRPHISYREFLDLDWFSETRVIHIDSHFEFFNGAFFQLPAINLTREGLQDPFEIAEGVVVPPGTYDNVEWGFAFNTDESAPLSINSRITIGGFYSGHRKGATGTINARLGTTLAAGLRFGYDDVDLREGSFETAVISLRVAYSFTPRIYLQSLIQYNNQTDNFSSNVRFGWLNTAGTGLFLVYNDVELVQPRGTRLEPVNRAFILKFTRQFNLIR